MNKFTQTVHSTLLSVEKIGNKVPGPVTFFCVGIIFIILIAHVLYLVDYSVASFHALADNNGTITWEQSDKKIYSTTIVSTEGAYWFISKLVHNFVSFPPLGVVLVGMMGIIFAEQTGFLRALIIKVTSSIADAALIPATIFIGIVSSVVIDAGYIVLPPLAAVVFRAAGMSPIVGIACAFAGVAAGFNANIFISGLDPLLSSLSTLSAQSLIPDYEVAVTSNYWFMLVSTFTITLSGWLVTVKIIAPLYPPLTPESNLVPSYQSKQIRENLTISQREERSLQLAIITLLLLSLLFIATTVIEGGPLHGKGNRFERWIESLIPILFFLFTIPGLVYGISAGTIRKESDINFFFIKSVEKTAPILVLCFFASQFIAVFKYTRLDNIIAISGSQILMSIELSPTLTLILFVLFVFVANIFVLSASAKYSVLAPVFIPMFMVLQIRPELTQAAYRIGDSVSEVLSPLNPYILIILALLQQYLPRAGVGTVFALMLPYTLLFLIIWTIQLLLWYHLGIPLGPGDLG